MRGAYVRDIREHPSLHQKLYCARHYGRNHLRGEHGARWNFHVVTKLEVRGECESASHGDVAPGLKHHHCDRTTRKEVADDEFSDDVQSNLLICDSLDHSYWDNVDKSYRKYNKKAFGDGRMASNLPIARARINAHTGICVFQISMVKIPNTNMLTTFIRYVSAVKEQISG